jgi:peroxiredoxin
LPAVLPVCIFVKDSFMRCRLIVLALFFAATAATLWLARPSSADNPSTAQVGKKIANVSFTDDKGATFMLHDLKDKKAIVLVFLSFDCPVSTSYSQVLAEMAGDFGKQGVTFVGLTVNQDESRAEVAKQAKAWKLPFPVVLDKDYAAVDAVKAEFTPEVFVLDGNHVLRYRGRIDNSYYARLKKNQQVTQHDLLQVLSEIISGRPVSTCKRQPRLARSPTTRTCCRSCKITARSATGPVRSGRFRC